MFLLLTTADDLIAATIAVIRPTCHSRCRPWVLPGAGNGNLDHTVATIVAAQMVILHRVALWNIVPTAQRIGINERYGTTPAPATGCDDHLNRH